MIGLETNIFPITNLDNLSAKYRLYRIKGLRPEQDEYYQNRQYLTNQLSRQYKNPILTIQRGENTFLVVRDDLNIPDRFDLIRKRVSIEPASDFIDLDFSCRTKENEEICQRFLQFMIQDVLFHSPSLWQPEAGRPFFEYVPINPENEIQIYRGYSVRVTPTQNGSLGLCIDVSGKLVGRDPLPSYLTREEFHHWKQKHVIYHYGKQWYEIQILALDDHTCGEYEFKVGDSWINLLENAVKESYKPIPQDLAKVKKDFSVVLYHNGINQERAAISSLCYPVFDTESDPKAAYLHSELILSPQHRRQLISNFVREHFTNIAIGNSILKISSVPNYSEVRMFNIPDLLFGRNVRLSVIGSEGANQVSLDRLGSTRKALLLDRNAGFYTRSLLNRQYIVIPSSIMQSYGEFFLENLIKIVNTLYPFGDGYNPEIIEYDDRGQRTFISQGKTILQALERANVQPGYALVMVHPSHDRIKRQEDPLSGMITAELRGRYDITSSVIHSELPGASYQEIRTKNGSITYQIDNNPQKRGKLIGYLRNVALNKILLTNEKWPFVLDKQLHADIVIGIDIKQHTAGLVVISEGGRCVRPFIRTSRQKERLLADQMRDYLIEVLRQAASSSQIQTHSIVLQRDGRTYQSEIKGVEDSIRILKDEGILHPEVSLTIIEIPKTSPVPIRLFDLSHSNGKAENPQVGCYYLINENEGYLCSTGRAFAHRGTTKPLHVKKIYGAMPIIDCLEDVYALSTLAWSKPDDCSRYPITLKLCDRYLTEDATDYDVDALIRAETSEHMEEETNNE